MQYDLISLQPVLPEIFMLGAACVVLVVDLFLTQRTRFWTYGLTLTALVGAIALTAWVAGPEKQVLFDGSYVRDPMADVVKIALLTINLFVVAYARDYLIQQEIYRGEFYILLLFATIGMMVIASSGNFLTAYLGLELLALSMYALVAFDRDSIKGSEAAMKYFVLGALASGMLLYGISMLYGASGALNFSEVSAAIATGNLDETVLVFGLVFVVIGVAFKFGAVPFHMWVPDVYHGAPTAVTLFLGSVPKIAAFALFIRLLGEGVGQLSAHWSDMLTILAIASLAIGNIVAIAQDNIKRMLAYSTISHVGFIFLGFIAADSRGYSASLFYAVVYALTAAGGFGLLTLISRKGFDAENLHDLKGVNDRSPWLAAMMMLIMFSMAGVPPTVGFFAKLFVLEAVVHVDKVWLAAVAVFFSIIGAFYYLRVVKVMYFDKPIDDQPIVASLDSRVAISLNGMAILLLGIFPTGLLAVCRAAFGA